MCMAMPLNHPGPAFDAKCHGSPWFAQQPCIHVVQPFGVLMNQHFRVTIETASQSACLPRTTCVATMRGSERRWCEAARTSASGHSFFFLARDLALIYHGVASAGLTACRVDDTALSVVAIAIKVPQMKLLSFRRPDGVASWGIAKQEGVVDLGDKAPALKHALWATTSLAEEAVSHADFRL